MVAAKLSNLARGGNRGNQYTGGKASIDVLPDAIAAALENLGEGRPVKTASFLAVSQEEAANSLNISERSIGRARTVYRDGSKAQ